MLDVLNRVKNMVYTTSDKYDVGVEMKGENSYTDTENVTVATVESFTKMGLTEDEAMSIVMYAAGHEGAHVKLSDISAIKKVMRQARNDGADLNILNGLIQIAEDYRVDSTTSKERPGYWAQRMDSTKATTKLFQDKPTMSKTANMIKATSFFTYGSDLRNHGWGKAPIDWDKARKTADDLSEIAKLSTSSTELITKVYKYYKDEFGLPKKKTGDKRSKDSDKTSESESPSLGDGSDTSDGASGERDSKAKETGEDSKDTDSKGDENTDSKDTKETDDKASGGESGRGGDDVSDDIDDECSGDYDLDKIIEDLEAAVSGSTSTISEMIGKDATKTLEKRKDVIKSKRNSLKEFENSSKTLLEHLKKRSDYVPVWSEDERKRIQSQLSVGVHAGADILYARRNSFKRVFDKSELDMMNRLARVMGSKLTQVLKSEVNDMGYTSSSGSKIMANKVWKPVYTGDREVFYKKDFTETGGYVIDLILDASGSQGMRVRNIAYQAYIIAEACSIAGIPCRVTQFRNRHSFTILELLRDFDEDRKNNINCANFNAEGDNRDGLAIQIANVELQKRSESNKVMLVLSDGCPCDGSGMAKIEAFGGVGSYVSKTTMRSGVDKATKDVYDVVRSIRKSGTALMGIYVGDAGYTLDIEKAIYGNDFAYIGNDMSVFVDVVMKYLVRHIQGLDK